VRPGAKDMVVSLVGWPVNQGSMQMRAGELLRNQRASDMKHEVRHLALHNTTCLV
jgi:hypothetical protein